MKYRVPQPFVFCVCLAALAVSFGGQTAMIHTQPLLRFAAFGDGLPTSGEWREGFRVVDLNGDGYPDIVHGPARKKPGPPSIFLGDGKGSWTRWKEAHFPPLPYDYGDIEVADFNGDGHPDLALTVHYRGLLVLLGDGKGTFEDSHANLGFDENSSPEFSSRAIRSTDWNGDGRPDLVAVWEGPRFGSKAGIAVNGVAIFLNQGPAGWRKREPELSPGIVSDSVALADFDGDGHLDIATGSLVMGRKDLVNLWRAGGNASSLKVEIPGDFHYVQAVAAGDFDRDGRADLAVAYLSLEKAVWYSELDLFYSRSGGKWERRTLSREAGRNVVVAMTTGHVRGPGARDLVALTTNGETIVYLGNEQGGLIRNDTSIPIYGQGCRGTHVELADLDGDGRDEIVSAFGDEPSAERCPSGGGITAWKAIMYPVNNANLNSECRRNATCGL
jgi:hypothetical protein